MLPEMKAGPMVKGIKYLFVPVSQSGPNDRACQHSRQEVVEIKRIVVKHQSSGVSDDLEEQAAAHAHHEPPGPVSNTQRKLQQQDEPQHGTVSGISGQAWQERYLTTLQRACLDGAGGRVLWTSYVHGV
jgi:hypothetical protein